jgi:uncharacterized protein YeaO (DUF488 family)
MIRIRRAYDPPAAEDGFRVLVDRLWPRGLRKDHAAIDLWLRDIAPSAALRRWFGHDPAKWRTFCRRYAGELKEKGEALGFLRAKGRGGAVTLLFGARDREFNNAVALRDIIARRRGRGSRRLGGGAALAQGAARRPDRGPRRRRSATARGLGRGDHRADPRRRS